MAKTVPANIQASLDSGATTLTTIWDITRTDGVIVRLTELDRDVVFDGNTYESAYGYSRTALLNRTGLEFDEIDLEGIFNDSFVARDDIVAGNYDDATLLVRLIDWETPTDGSVIITKGRMGRVVSRPDGLFTAQLTTLRALLDKNIVELTSPTCRAQLGDARCKVPLQPDIRSSDTEYALGDFIRVATINDGTEQEDFENRIYECVVAGTTASTAPTYDTTEANQTVDGTATFEARRAWTRHATVLTVTSRTEFTIVLDESRAVDDWYNQGFVRFETGENAGRVFEVKDWAQGNRIVNIYLPAPGPIEIGDKLAIAPGCNKLRETCIAKFVINNSLDFSGGNILNFRGEPDVPGADAASFYPGAN